MLPRPPGPAVARLMVDTTPGTDFTKSSGLRLLLATFKICLFTSAASRSALSVCSSAPTALTSTFSVTAPTCTVKSPSAIRSLALTTTLSCTYSRKPVDITVSRYVPGATCGNTKRPAASVIAVRLYFFSNSLAVTLAFGMPACCESTTVPEMTPLVVCAAMGRLTTSRKLKHATRVLARRNNLDIENLPLLALTHKTHLLDRISTRLERCPVRRRPPENTSPDSSQR